MTPPPAPTYSLYAERDGIAYGWSGFADNLADTESTRALLDQARHELATMNAASSSSGYHSTCYIHLLQHATPHCDCLEEAEPGGQCHVVETFAPEPHATAAQNTAAAVTWLAAFHVNVGADLSEIVRETAAPGVTQPDSQDPLGQLAYLLGKFGQRKTLALLTAAATGPEHH
ncbi:hypothetical protein [Streptomyces chartreusis]|uniref:hypothetical protein n=1 Tax=Streptomyces chartreusis TaxID=1969 RepID=UPI002F91457F|nr:hypothetical protein OG938_44325 [Streptomyces chartreusis]